MKTTISFEIHYNTRPGENIHIIGTIPQLGSGKIENSMEMKYFEGKWKAQIELKKKESFTYSYFLKDEYSQIVPEAGSVRPFIPGSFDSYYLFDNWRPFNDETPFDSDAFKKILCRTKSIESFEYDEILITCTAFNLSENDVVLISGNNSKLGNWNEKRALEMKLQSPGVWYLTFKREELAPNSEYKFILRKGDNYYIWENGINRNLPDYKLLSAQNYSLILNNSINLSSPKPRFAGTAIPVFSLRSTNSCGIGEFLDLIPFADFLSETGQRVLQILPVNDTTINNNWEDSYPYGAVSIFALHPLYINLKEAGTIKDNEFMQDFNRDIQGINALEEIDYDLVSKLKWRYLKKLFIQDGLKTLRSREFNQFFNNNSSWLKPYAAFSFLRDLYGTANFSSWNKYSIYDKLAIEILTSSESDSYNDISLYYFIQYHLDRQLKIAHEYVNSKGIILKGDIPIGINRCSVEAWCEPQYFNFNGQAGAPPDDFSVKGQNWGFPTYNWDYMEREGYDWWRRRFQKMAEYFDAYRIDHILGFFRIWEVPSSSIEGLMGFFNPSLPFTADEIRILGYDFNFERDCTPYIRESIIKEYFKDDSTEIISCFFDHIEFDVYRFKPQFSNQRQIDYYFVSNPNHRLLRHKESLFSLITEVLFIQDPYDNNKYHPRISAQYTRSYQSLPEWLKESYNKIYNLFFYHRNDGYWFNSAMKKLPSLISSTDMLVCGEDLGMIPSCVPTAMKSLSILSLEIERMPKDPNSKFGKTSEYPYLSVCTTGTHDTSTLRGWWEENRSVTQEYYNNILNEKGESPIFCEPWICIKIIKNHLNSPSMLTVLPLQDWLSIFPELRKENPNSERINIPSNPKHYWRYRMHLNIEEMNSNKNLVSTLKTLILDSGR